MKSKSRPNHDHDAKTPFRRSLVRGPDGRDGTLWFGGVGIGLAVVAMWWISGRLGFIAEHPQTLEATFLATNSRGMEALSMVAPIGYALDWILLFSDTSKVLTIGIVSMAGVATGSAIMSLASRQFRWEGFSNVEDTANHLVGATLMGMLFIAALVGAGLVLAAKLVPAYLEFMAVKKVLHAMAASGDLKSLSPKEIQNSFFKRANIDNIHSVKSEDITIAREGNQSMVTVEYSLKVPVVANISACMDFLASSSAQGE